MKDFFIDGIDKLLFQCLLSDIKYIDLWIKFIFRNISPDDVCFKSVTSICESCLTIKIPWHLNVVTFAKKLKSDNGHDLEKIYLHEIAVDKHLFITILFRKSNFECSFNSVSKVLQKNAKLCHISLDNLDVDTNQELQALVEQGLNERVVKPLDCKIFGHDRLAEAVDFKDKHRHQRVAVQVIVVTLLLVSLLWIRMTTPTVFISYFFCLNTEQ